jgi:benzoylformate decarboxylase
MIVGNEVSAYRARKEAVTLAEVVGCPVFCEPMPTGVNFPNRHPQFAGVLPLNLYSASDKLQSYDVILIIGMQTRIPSKPTEPSMLPPSAYIIQLNVEPGLAGRTLPCDLVANADIGESLSRVRAEIQLFVESNWVTASKLRANQTIAEISNRRQEQDDAAGYPSSQAPISLNWLLRLLDSVRPQNSLICNDLVCESADPYEILNLENSSSYFGSNGGIAGHAPAAALGVQWASPESVVVCITSDESVLYYPQAFWTASHYGLAVKFVIVNSLGRANFNVRLSPLVRSEARIVLDNPALSFTELAHSMSVGGGSVSSMGQLEAALKVMFETPGPFVLDVHVQEESE